MVEASRPVVLAGAFALVALPTVGLWALAFGGRPSAALAAVALPLLALLAFGVVLGRKVAASPDDPEVVDDVVAESLGSSREELEEFFE